MKKQFKILLALLFISQLAWGQCDDYFDLEVTYDQATTALKVVLNPVDSPAREYTSIPYTLRLFVGDVELAGTGGSNNVGSNGLFSPTEQTFNVAEEAGLMCEDGFFSCDDCVTAPMSIRFESIFTVRNDTDTICTNNGNGGFPLIPCATEDDGGVTIDDDRQVGNIIEDLGDGRVSVLNDDGTVIAFSSSGGYYICELVGETWTPAK